MKTLIVYSMIIFSIINLKSQYLTKFAVIDDYDFVKGNFHFFVIDSEPNETYGVDSNIRNWSSIP
ncbi:MAG: hypothetical protein LH629_10435 [Ignavibacteria bacterium]|nr:hypothetical protein [Ignavibacteria bacterium]